MAVANLEAVLFPTLAKLIDQPQRVATAIFENIDNISARLSIVFELAELKKETPIGAVLLSHKAGVLKAVAMRNKLAHSLYGYNEDTGEVLLLHNYLSNRRDGPKESVLNPVELDGHSQVLANAAAFISIEVGDTDLTPRHRQKGKR